MFGSLFGSTNSLFGSTSLTSGLTNVIGGVSDAISGIATGVANGLSTAVSELDKGLSDLGDTIAVNTPDIPLLKGVVNAAATIVDGATDAVEIVAHHLMMWVAELGQAVGTVGNGAADTIDAIFEGDPEGVLCVLQDTAGKLIITNQQYTAAHLAHDVELIQIPLEMVSEGLSEILCSVIGDNLLSQAPYMLDGVQKLVIDAGVYQSVIVPLMTAWASANEAAFGDLVGTLSPEDMGMGYNFNEDYWQDHSGHNMGAMDVAGSYEISTITMETDGSDAVTVVDTAVDPSPVDYLTVDELAFA